MIIKNLETKDTFFRNVTLNALSVNVFLNGLQNAGPQAVDFSKATLKLILNRDGKMYVIMQDNLKVIGLASTIDRFTQSAFATTLNPAVNTSGGATGLVSFVIPLGGHLNLKGDDELYLEVYSGNDFYTNAGLEASSYLEIKPMKSVGYETFIPSFKSYVIQQNETSNQYMIGDNVIRLVVLNYDKTSFTTNVVQQLTFNSDRLNDSWTFPDLIVRKLNRFGLQPLNPAVAADESIELQEDQSFVISDFHEQFNQVMLDIQFNGPNVASSSNFICAWTYITSGAILNKAANMQAKHFTENASQIPATTGGSTKK